MDVSVVGDIAYRDGCTGSIVKVDSETVVFSYTEKVPGMECEKEQTITMPYELFDRLIRKHLGWCD